MFLGSEDFWKENEPPNESTTIADELPHKVNLLKFPVKSMKCPKGQEPDPRNKCRIVYSK